MQQFSLTSYANCTTIDWRSAHKSYDYRCRLLWCRLVTVNWVQLRFTIDDFDYYLRIECRKKRRKNIVLISLRWQNPCSFRLTWRRGFSPLIIYCITFIVDHMVDTCIDFVSFSLASDVASLAAISVNSHKNYLHVVQFSNYFACTSLLTL